MSDTPRTDALLSSRPECLGRYDYDLLAEHAKTLEREIGMLVEAVLAGMSPESKK